MWWKRAVSDILSQIHHLIKKRSQNLALTAKTLPSPIHAVCIMVGVILQLLPLGSQYHAKNNYWCNHGKKPKNLIFNSTSNYSMHGLDYRSRAMTVTNYLESQLVGLTFRVVGPSGRLPPPEGVARPALGTPK
jgi:hypothetical protein